VSMDGRTGKKNEGRSGAQRHMSFARLPLWRVFIVLFVAQVLLAVGLVGYISAHNARKAVNEVARQLRNEVTTRIEGRLLLFLATPHTLDEMNANLIARGVLDSSDAGALSQHFWQQVQAAPSVSSLYFRQHEGRAHRRRP
jgi:hypothetical protein